MVIVSPSIRVIRVVGPLPNGRNLWLINRGDPNHVSKSWDDPPTTFFAVGNSQVSVFSVDTSVTLARLIALDLPCASNHIWFEAPTPFCPTGVQRVIPKRKTSYLVGGWTNPFEKYARQNGFIFPNFRGENKRYLKPPTRISNSILQGTRPGRCRSSSLQKTP